MRLLTWNMGYWAFRAQHDEAWRWLLEELDPEIALVQECVPPQWVLEDRMVIWDQAYPDSQQDWGTALVSRVPARRAELPEIDDWLRELPASVPGTDKLGRVQRLRGWVACAEIDTPTHGTVLVVSVHNPSQEIERTRLKGIDISSMKLKANADLWLLDVLFHSLKDRLGAGLIVGGDFNYSRLLDDLYGERGNHEFFDRIETEGFVSLHRMFHPADEQTFFRSGGREHQLDYLFADSGVAQHSTSCRVVEHSECVALSDHAPVVAELSL